MNHRQATEHLPDYAAGHLAGPERAALAAHLERCAACRGWLETYRACAELLGRPLRQRGQDHPDSGELARYAVEPAALSELEARRIDRHLDRCAECGAAVELGRQAVAEAETGAEPAGRRPRRRALATPWRLALAAALVAALGLALFGRGRPAPPAGQVIAGQALAGQRVISDDQSITATGTRIEGGADVTFRAGTAVALGDGFTVGSEARFTVEIADPPRRR